MFTFGSTQTPQTNLFSFSTNFDPARVTTWNSNSNPAQTSIPPNSFSWQVPSNNPAVVPSNTPSWLNQSASTSSTPTPNPFNWAASTTVPNPTPFSTSFTNPFPLNNNPTSTNTNSTTLLFPNTTSKPYSSEQMNSSSTQEKLVSITANPSFSDKSFEEHKWAHSQQQKPQQQPLSSTTTTFSIPNSSTFNFDWNKPITTQNTTQATPSNTTSFEWNKPQTQPTQSMNSPFAQSTALSNPSPIPSWLSSSTTSFPQQFQSAISTPAPIAATPSFPGISQANPTQQPAFVFSTAPSQPTISNPISATITPVFPVVNQAPTLTPVINNSEVVQSKPKNPFGSDLALLENYLEQQNVPKSVSDVSLSKSTTFTEVKRESSTTISVPLISFPNIKLNRESRVQPKYKIAEMKKQDGDYWREDEEQKINLSTTLPKISLVDLDISMPSIQQANFPTLTKQDYYTVPNMKEIQTMNSDQLKKVINFAIGRTGVGRIVFPGLTDITGLCLDNIVIIEPKYVEIYPSGMEKPKHGEGLNKSCQVTLHHVLPTKNKSTVEYEQVLRNSAKKYGIQFVSYVNYEWKFEIK